MLLLTLQTSLYMQQKGLSIMFEYYETLITPQEAADMIGCGMNSMYKLLNGQKIKAFRIGRRWKIPKRAIQEYIIQETKMKATGW